MGITGRRGWIVARSWLVGRNDAMRNQTFRSVAGVLAGAALACCLTAAEARSGTAVPPGTSVPLEFSQQVSTKTARKGDEIRLRVYQEIAKNGRTLIRKDA